MFPNKQPAVAPAETKRETNLPYLIMNLSLALIFPGISMIAEHLLEKTFYSWHLFGKWFIFFAVGMRLFTAGIKQASNPEFTATKIFKLQNSESYTVIRELGFANIALGIMGILSVINDNWRLLASVSGGIFFGLAALQHALKKPDSFNETIVLLYDVFVFLALEAYLILTLLFQPI